VISAVLWLEPGGIPPTSPFEDRAGDLLSATRHFTGVELYRLTAEDIFSRGLPGMLPLVAFSAQRADLEAIERAARLVQERAPAGDVPELETLLAVFAGRRFDMATMRALLRRVFMNTEIIETSSLYQEIIARGREQGIEQGIEQGVQHEAAEAVRVVLRSRFGELTPEIEAAISEADVNHLHAALAQAVTATTDELLALLREGKPQE
jgi:predicted transposase YdaD